MELDVDILIGFFQRYNDKQKDLDEQETPSSGGETSTAGSSTGKSPKKWETGLTRGKANPIGNTVWASGRKFGKTYMNDPKYVWKSDRVMGKTGGSDYA